MKILNENFPHKPGIYKMLDQSAQVIYVGKAKDLKKRINSYFFNKNLDLKTSYLVKHIQNIEIIVTKTEKEALILENQLIKLLKPKYNILLRDDKNYPYIKINLKDPFPKIDTVRYKDDDQALYFGPYPGIGSLRHLKKLLQELFGLRECRQIIDLVKKQKKCLNLDLGRCLGPCVYKHVKPEYDSMVNELVLFLSGKSKQIIKKLLQQMKLLANNLEFEKANKIKKRIEKLNYLQEKQYVSLAEDETFDIWAFVEQNEIYYVLAQSVIDGNLLMQKGFYLQKNENQDFEFFLEQCFFAFYTEQKAIPSKIIADEKFEAVFNNLILKMNLKINLIFPKIGNKFQLLKNAKLNAKTAISRLKIKFEQDYNIGLSLKKKLNLKQIPYKIMGVDISHLGSKQIVGAVVYFENFKPYKNLYRKFNIRSVNKKSNDPQAIYETVLRRLSLALSNKENLPHLILIDGGKAQLNFAYKALLELNLQDKVEILALAKKEESVFFPKIKDPVIKIKQEKELFFLLQVRDEAHRFVHKSQIDRRNVVFQKTKLYDIKGLGQKRIDALFRQFKSIKNIKNQNVKDLAKVGKIGKKLAEKIKKELLYEK